VTAQRVGGGGGGGGGGVANSSKLKGGPQAKKFEKQCIV